MEPRKMPPNAYEQYAKVFRENYFTVLNICADLRRLGIDRPEQQLRDALSICVGDLPSEDADVDQIKAQFGAAASAFQRRADEIAAWRKFVDQVDRIKGFLQGQKIGVDPNTIQLITGLLQMALSQAKIGKSQEAQRQLDETSAKIHAAAQAAPKLAKAAQPIPRPAEAEKKSPPLAAKAPQLDPTIKKPSSAAMLEKFQEMGPLNLNPKGNPHNAEREIEFHARKSPKEKPIAEPKAPEQAGIPIPITVTPRIPIPKVDAKAKGDKKAVPTSIFLAFPNKEVAQAFLSYLLQGCKLTEAEQKKYYQFTDDTTLQLKAVYKLEEKVSDRDFEKYGMRAAERNHQWELQAPDTQIADNWKKFIGQETLTRPDGSPASFVKNFPPQTAEPEPPRRPGF